MREFLKGLDLDKETIDTIMAEHGKHITGLKEQVDEYKTKVSELTSKVDENTKSLENLQSVTSERDDLKAQLQMSNSNVKKEFSKFVTSEIMAQVNDDHDFASVLETYKKDNPQYFGDTIVRKVQSSPSLNTGGNQAPTSNDIMNDIIRGAKSN